MPGIREEEAFRADIAALGVDDEAFDEAVDIARWALGRKHTAGVPVVVIDDEQLWMISIRQLPGHEQRLFRIVYTYDEEEDIVYWKRLLILEIGPSTVSSNGHHS